MNKRLFNFGCFVLLWMFSNSCSDKWDSPAFQKEQSAQSSFSVQHAQTFFEENATALQPLSFASKVATRSDTLPLSELTPLWEKAIACGNKEVQMIEIPILANSLTVVCQHTGSGNKQNSCDQVIASKKLIVEKRKNGTIQAFLVTLIPDKSYRDEHLRHPDNFRYLGGSRFSGMVFCSSLDGHFGEAFEYKDGQKTRRLYVAKAAEMKTTLATAPSESYIVMNLTEAVQTRSGTYRFNENTGDVCAIHNIRNCDCDESVVIIPDCLVCGQEGTQCGCCQKCRTYWYQNCEHKPCCFCFQHPCICKEQCRYCFSHPCTCHICPYCHSRFCYGECLDPEGETKPDPDPYCPYGKCTTDPCSCCTTCYGPCQCPFQICHKRPCVCCSICHGPCRCPAGKCHEYPCICPCFDLENNEADPFRDATISTDNISWKSNTWGYNREKGTKFHDGLDLIGQTGVTPVQAMYPGKVIKVVSGQPNRTGEGKYPVGYSGDDNNAGNRVMVESVLPDGTTQITHYWHLDVQNNNPYTKKLKVGDQIGQGQAIGVVGYTGNSNKDFPHLHLKTSVPGTGQKTDPRNDPRKYLYTKFDPNTGQVVRACD